jgi:hypothetical protein
MVTGANKNEPDTDDTFHESLLINTLIVRYLILEGPPELSPQPRLADIFKMRIVHQLTRTDRCLVDSSRFAPGRERSG